MFRVIEENDKFIVVSKEHSINFHNDGDEPGVFSGVKEYLGKDLFAVHRIDKVTSGLLLFAKDSNTAATFSKMFQDKKIVKFYCALSDKKPDKKMGTIKGDMVKSRNGSWRLSRGTDNPAVTKFISRKLSSDGIYMFILRIYTGKTHQIRVAMKSLGSPVAGDILYGSSENYDRVYLHSYYLGFNFEGKDYCYKSSPDQGKLFTNADFADAFKEFYTPESLDFFR